MLDLKFTDEQEMLRETVRGICATLSPFEVVRQLEDDPIGYSKDLWKQLGELDLIGLMLPEEFGGSEMTALEGVVLYEEFGRSLAATPHFVSAVLSAGALTRVGSADQKQEWLPRIASGEAILTPAWLEPDNGFGPQGVQVRAVSTGGGFKISGRKRHVAYAAAADAFVVLARTGDLREDVDLFIVKADAPGVTLTQQMTIASETQYQVDFADVEVSAADRIGPESTGWITWNGVMHDGIILAAAQAVGGSQYALEITNQYAKDRHQFDKPLGAFQALAHYLADATTNIDGAETLVHEAAWARSDGRPVNKLAPMAKLYACNTYRDVTATAQQIFGGIGFTVEFDIQLYFRRAKALQLSWWDTRYLEELIATAVLDH
jgi:alkylation response protein AidB-like acyl-CoA dehydrogenase